MDLKNILIVGVVSGASAWLFNLFLRRMHHRYVDPIPFENKELARQTDQFRKLRVKCGREELILVCRDAVSTLKKSKIKIFDPDSHFIKAKIGMTFRSVGEVFTIRVKGEGEGASIVELFSKPWLCSTQIDYGKNFENIELICEFLGQRYPVERIAANK